MTCDFRRYPRRNNFVSRAYFASQTDERPLLVFRPQPVRLHYRILDQQDE